MGSSWHTLQDQAIGCEVSFKGGGMTVGVAAGVSSRRLKFLSEALKLCKERVQGRTQELIVFKRGSY